MLTKARDLRRCLVARHCTSSLCTSYISHTRHLYPARCQDVVNWIMVLLEWKVDDWEGLEWNIVTNFNTKCETPVNLSVQVNHLATEKEFLLTTLGIKNSQLHTNMHTLAKKMKNVAILFPLFKDQPVPTTDTLLNSSIDRGRVLNNSFNNQLTNKSTTRSHLPPPPFLCIRECRVWMWNTVAPLE